MSDDGKADLTSTVVLPGQDDGDVSSSPATPFTAAESPQETGSARMAQFGSSPPDLGGTVLMQGGAPITADMPFQQGQSKAEAPSLASLKELLIPPAVNDRPSDQDARQLARTLSKLAVADTADLEKILTRGVSESSQLDRQDLERMRDALAAFTRMLDGADDKDKKRLESAWEALQS